MLFFLNNCHNFDHAKTYGGRAMFDLWAEGFEDKTARELSTGDMCLVVSHAGKDKLSFSRHRFTGTRLVTDPSDTKRDIWVLEGEIEGRETLTRSEAVSRTPYSRFFNKRGHLNQWSVVRGN